MGERLDGGYGVLAAGGSGSGSGSENGSGSGSGSGSGIMTTGEVGGGLVLQVWNANNHQLTYGVFGATVTGLRNWMVLNGVFGTVRFEVFDGINQVGWGTIE